MGETATETVREIDRTRSRLDAELHELESYLPVGVRWAKRAVGVLVGGGVVTSAVWFLVRRKRERKGGRRLRDMERRVERIETELARPSATGRLGRRSA